MKLKKLKQTKRKNKMATLKSKNIRKMGKNDREKKLKELRMELVKSSVKGNSKMKEIKKIIARILNESKKSEGKIKDKRGVED